MPADGTYSNDKGCEEQGQVQRDGRAACSRGGKGEKNLDAVGVALEQVLVQLLGLVEVAQPVLRQRRGRRHPLAAGELRRQPLQIDHSIALHLSLEGYHREHGTEDRT